MSQEALHLVNSIQGVIKFVGHRQAAAAAAPGRGQPPAGRGRGASDDGPEGGDPVPPRPGGRDHRGPVLRLQRHGRGSAGRQGQGEGVGQPVRPADDRGDWTTSSFAVTRAAGAALADPAGPHRHRAGYAGARGGRSAPIATRSRMAKKIQAVVKLQVPAGAANPAPPVGHGAGSARRQHHGVLQAVQRADPGPERNGDPGRGHDLRRPDLHVHHQDARRRRTSCSRRRASRRGAPSRTGPRSAR